MELIVSDFMTNACHVCPRPNLNRIDALWHVINTTKSQFDEGDYNLIATSSGSASEFYIEPLLSCINDIDIMWHRNDMLAIPEGYPVPRCLPAEFHREVEVFELEETEYPCYVLARSVWKLIKCTNSDNYTRVSNVHGYTCMYAGTTGDIESTNRHGPAVFHENRSPALRCFTADKSGLFFRSMDLVKCFRCLVWPPQAAEWTTRRREFNWPDTSTINGVVNSGCDVVQVAHPRCRKDGQMNIFQWRLSFSRAETVLLNTWSPTQQLVYHMLRVFITSIRNDIGESVIKRYFIKTLMLWMCELHSLMWESSCVVNICRQLLHKLANCLLSAQFPMYFVAECNLTDGIEYTNVFEVNVAKCLNVNNEYIAIWFVNTYINKFVCHCPLAVSLWNAIRTLTDFQCVLTTISNARQHYCIEVAFDNLFVMHCLIERILSKCSPSLSQLLRQINSVDLLFTDSIRAVYLLKAVSLLDHGYDTRLVVKYVITALQSVDEFKLSTYLPNAYCIAEYIAFSTDDNDAASELLAGFKYFQCASSLMQTVRCSKNNKLTLLLKELTKMFLFDSLKHICDGDSHTGAVRVYMACLYYSTGQYRTALEYCVAAITSVQSGNNVNCVERQLLPQFDDNIEHVLGIILLYQFVHKSSLNQVQQAECNDVYSVDLLAHYLVALCLKKQHFHSKCCAQNKFHFQYRQRLHNSENIFIADILIFRLQQVGHKHAHKLYIYSISHTCPFILASRKPVSTQFNANRFSRLLIQSSVEYLTSLRRIMSHYYSSVCTIVTRDYEAMYEYKCGLYEQCLNLSYEAVSCFRYAFVRLVLVSVKSLLFLLIDDECLSLISLARLCGVFDIDPKREEYVTQQALSVYLVVQCKLRLRHSVTSLIELLRVIQRVHDMHDKRFIISRGMMAFIYRKTTLRLN